MMRKEVENWPGKQKYLMDLLHQVCDQFTSTLAEIVNTDDRAKVMHFLKTMKEALDKAQSYRPGDWIDKLVEEIDSDKR